MNTELNFFFVADTAFPHGNAALRYGGFIPKSCTNETLHITETAMQAVVKFDNQLLSCRQAAE